MHIGCYLSQKLLRSQFGRPEYSMAIFSKYYQSACGSIYDDLYLTLYHRQASLIYLRSNVKNSIPTGRNSVGKALALYSIVHEFDTNV